jgi:hypothetical protein
VQAYKGIRQAADAQLAEIRHHVTELLDTYGIFLGGDMVTGLCLLREGVTREQKRRSVPGGAVIETDSVRPGEKATATASA